MKSRSLITPRLVFTVVFLTALPLLFVNLGAYVLYSRSCGAFLVVILASLLFIGISYDLAELTAAALSPPRYPAKLRSLAAFPAVAILYVTRHDARADCLRTVAQQDYKNCRLFILDDSDDDRQVEIFRSFDCVVCRRTSRQGYKAGNLNNWLRQYGRMYEYFVIADADSKLPPDFVTKMLRFAEHPANRHIAIFQSRILPWNGTSPFTRPLRANAVVRMSVSSRVCNVLGTLLSYGHNNLHRTSAVLAVGGFSESFSPEDTTLSLQLSQFGLHCRLVDVVSHDAEPSDMPAYLRRSARWCQQTAEVLRCPWRRADWRLKVAVLRNLLSYCLHIAYPALLLTTMLEHRVEGTLVVSSFQYFLWANRYDVLLIWMLPLAALLANLSLQAWHAWRAGVSIRSFVSSLPLSFAITACSTPAIARALWREARGRRVVFDPTNEVKGRSVTRFRVVDLWGLCWFPISLAVFVLFLSLMHPWNLIAYANLIWVAIAVAAPCTVWATHKNVSLG